MSGQGGVRDGASAPADRSHRSASFLPRSAEVQLLGSHLRGSETVPKTLNVCMGARTAASADGHTGSPLGAGSGVLVQGGVEGLLGDPSPARVGMTRHRGAAA